MRVSLLLWHSMCAVRRVIAQVFFISVKMAIACFALLAQEAMAKWNAQVEAEYDGGNVITRPYVKGMIPLVQTDKSMVFIDGRVAVYAQDLNFGEVNLGIGARTILGGDYIIGAYAFGDAFLLNNEAFGQFMIGAELLGYNVEARANFYMPESLDSTFRETQISANCSPVLTEVSMDTSMTSVEAAYGVDAEIGLRIHPTEAYTLAAFAGYYAYQTRDNALFDFDFHGPKARVEVIKENNGGTNNGLRMVLGFEVQTDDFWGDQAFVFVRLELDLGANKGRDELSKIERRMTEFVRRDDVINILNLEDTHNTTLNQAINSLIIPGFDGTFSNIVFLNASNDIVSAIQEAGPNSLLILDGGTGYIDIDEPITLLSGQVLMGSAILNSLPTPLANCITNQAWTPVLQTLAIPGTSSGPTIILSDDNIIIGIDIIGKSTTEGAILGEGVSRPILQNLNIMTVGDGVIFRDVIEPRVSYTTISADRSALEPVDGAAIRMVNGNGLKLNDIVVSKMMDGLVLTDSDGLEVNSLSMHNVTRNPISINGSRGVNINSARLFSDSGADRFITLDNTSRVEITDAIALGNLTNGFSVTNSSDVNVSKVNIQATTQRTLIFNNVTHSTLNDIYVGGSPDIGLDISDVSLMFISNLVMDNPSTALSIHGEADTVSADNVRIDSLSMNSSDFALRIDNAQNIIVDNIARVSPNSPSLGEILVTNSTNIALDATDSAEFSRLISSNNTVLRYDNMSFVERVSEEPPQNGGELIQIIDSTNTTGSNIGVDALEDAILISGGANNTLNDLVISGEGTGISFDNTTNVIIDSLYASNFATGLDIRNDTSGTISDATFDGVSALFNIADNVVSWTMSDIHVLNPQAQDFAAIGYLSGNIANLTVDGAILGDLSNKVFLGVQGTNSNLTNINLNNITVDGIFQFVDLGTDSVSTLNNVAMSNLQITGLQDLFVHFDSTAVPLNIQNLTLSSSSIAGTGPTSNAVVFALDGNSNSVGVRIIDSTLSQMSRVLRVGQLLGTGTHTGLSINNSTVDSVEHAIYITGNAEVMALSALDNIVLNDSNHFVKIFDVSDKTYDDLAVGVSGNMPNVAAVSLELCNNLLANNVIVSGGVDIGLQIEESSQLTVNGLSVSALNTGLNIVNDNLSPPAGTSNVTLNNVTLNDADVAINIDLSNNIRITELRALSGNTLGSINITDSTFIDIDNLIAPQVAVTGIMTSDSANISFRGLGVKSSDISGAAMTLDGMHSVSLSDFSIDGTSQTGLRISNDSTDITINNLSLSASVNNLVIDNINGTGENITIDGLVMNNAPNAIIISNSNGVAISNIFPSDVSLGSIGLMTVTSSTNINVSNTHDVLIAGLTDNNNTDISYQALAFQPRQNVPSGAIATVTGSTDITLSDITMSGAVDGLQVVGGSNLTISNLIVDVTGTAVSLDGVGNAVIDGLANDPLMPSKPTLGISIANDTSANISAVNFVDMPAFFALSNITAPITFNNTVFVASSATGSAAATIDGDISDLTIVGANISNLGDAAMIRASGGSIANVTIDAITADNLQGLLHATSDISNLTISNIDITGLHGMMLDVEGAVSGLLVQGSSIVADTVSAGVLTATGTTSGVVLENSAFSGFSKIINLSNSGSALMVSNNTITDSGNLIYAAGAASLTDVNIVDNNVSGIYGDVVKISGTSGISLTDILVNVSGTNSGVAALGIDNSSNVVLDSISILGNADVGLLIGSGVSNIANITPLQLSANSIALEIHDSDNVALNDVLISNALTALEVFNTHDVTINNILAPTGQSIGTMILHDNTNLIANNQSIPLAHTRSRKMSNIWRNSVPTFSYVEDINNCNTVLNNIIVAPTASVPGSAIKILNSNTSIYTNVSVHNAVDAISIENSTAIEIESAMLSGSGTAVILDRASEVILSGITNDVSGPLFAVGFDISGNSSGSITGVTFDSVGIIASMRDNASAVSIRDVTLLNTAGIHFSGPLFSVDNVSDVSIEGVTATNVGSIPYFIANTGNEQTISNVNITNVQGNGLVNFARFDGQYSLDGLNIGNIKVVTTQDVLVFDGIASINNITLGNSALKKVEGLGGHIVSMGANVKATGIAINNNTSESHDCAVWIVGTAGDLVFEKNQVSLSGAGSVVHVMNNANNITVSENYIYNNNDIISVDACEATVTNLHTLRNTAHLEDAYPVHIVARDNSVVDGVTVAGNVFRSMGDTIVQIEVSNDSIVSNVDIQANVVPPEMIAGRASAANNGTINRFFSRDTMTGLCVDGSELLLINDADIRTTGGYHFVARDNTANRSDGMQNIIIEQMQIGDTPLALLFERSKWISVSNITLAPEATATVAGAMVVEADNLTFTNSIDNDMQFSHIRLTGQDLTFNNIRALGERPTLSVLHLRNVRDAKFHNATIGGDSARYGVYVSSGSSNVSFDALDVHVPSINALHIADSDVVDISNANLSGGNDLVRISGARDVHLHNISSNDTNALFAFVIDTDSKVDIDGVSMSGVSCLASISNNDMAVRIGNVDLQVAPTANEDRAIVETTGNVSGVTLHDIRVNGMGSTGRFFSNNGTDPGMAHKLQSITVSNVTTDTLGNFLFVEGNHSLEGLSLRDINTTVVGDFVMISDSHSPYKQLSASSGLTIDGANVSFVKGGNYLLSYSGATKANDLQIKNSVVQGASALLNVSPSARRTVFMNCELINNTMVDVDNVMRIVGSAHTTPTIQNVYVDGNSATNGPTISLVDCQYSTVSNVIINDNNLLPGTASIQVDESGTDMRLEAIRITGPGYDVDAQGVCVSNNKAPLTISNSVISSYDKGIKIINTTTDMNIVDSLFIDSNVALSVADGIHTGLHFSSNRLENTSAILATANNARIIGMSGSANSIDMASADSDPNKIMSMIESGSETTGSIGFVMFDGSEH